MPTKRQRTTPSFAGLRPASAKASAAARSASAKTNSKCELMLRRELWRAGLRYRLHALDLPGRPDIVFPAQRVVVFCDGDFWHGRDLDARLARLQHGHNAPYWAAKIRRNVERDKQQTAELERAGWLVVRVWEGEVLRDVAGVAERIMSIVRRPEFEDFCRR